MKKLIIIFVTLISLGYSQIEKEATLFEYGHYEEYKEVVDTTIRIYLKIEIYTDKIIIYSKNTQTYNFIDLDKSTNNLKVYYSLDQDLDYCEVSIFFYEDIKFISINYNNCWLKYYF